jgi:hypothetical protein
MSSIAAEQNRPSGQPQFGLRTLFIVVTLLGVLFAAVALIGALWSLAIGFSLLLVVGHVAGNAIGTRLRQQADGDHGFRMPDSAPNDLPAEVVSGKRLTENSRLNRSVTALAILGAAIGAGVGSAALEHFSPPLSPSGLVLGTCSSAVLGGFIAFLLGSFWSITRSAWAEAIENEKSSHGSRPL